MTRRRGWNFQSELFFNRLASSNLNRDQKGDFTLRFLLATKTSAKQKIYQTFIMHLIFFLIIVLHLLRSSCFVISHPKSERDVFKPMEDPFY